MRDKDLPTSRANSYSVKEVYGRNPRITGPKGEPYKQLTDKETGRTVDQHSHGHRFNDNKTKEGPHWNGGKGNHYYED